MSGFQLEGQKVVVTGGGRGIGRSIVTHLAKAGAEVVFSFTGQSEGSEDKAKALCEQFKEYGKVTALPLDLSSHESIQNFSKEAQNVLGTVDSVVNNAGVVIDQLMLRYKPEDFEKVFKVNVEGSFFLSKAFLRPLMKSQNPSIVFLSSVVGQMGNAGQVPYSASKAALIAMAKSMAREMASRKLRVNCIAPGFIETDMTQELSEQAAKAITDNIPLKSLGQGSDIAHATMYLISPLARYVTGHVLNVNGGLYM